jgi:hypothetical protein
MSRRSGSFGKSLAGCCACVSDDVSEEACGDLEGRRDLIAAKLG